MRKPNKLVESAPLIIFAIAIWLSPLRCPAQAGVYGFIFDDANGNGMMDHTDAAGSLSHTLYAVLADSTGTIAAVGAVATNGSFSLTGLPLHTSGFHAYITDGMPSVGDPASTYSWPCGWATTMGQYGKNNLAGIGIDGFSGVQIPVSFGASDVTGLMIGFDRLAYTSLQSYLIPVPMPGTTRKLMPIAGLGALSALDPESGTLGANNTFIINEVSGLNGNKLFYDQNGNGILEPYEQIVGYTLFTKYDPSKLFFKFSGSGSLSASFTFNVADPAGQVGLTPSTYIASWVGALPVELEEFTATAEGRSAVLHWTTASETDNDHFDIERSPDAISWTKIGSKKGAGTTNSKTEYNLIDAAPLEDDNYYRLKQVDVDGQFVYTDIRGLTFDSPEQNKVAMFPNPVSSHSPFTIQLSNANTTISHISIANVLGEIVYQSQSVPQKNIGQIDDGALPAGSYLVSVYSDDAKTLSSLLVVR
jgi:hypothetical protein